ncbi:cytochrome P450 4V2-like [Stylophora pistillata]|uniref:cytochrome P450 4V2-like n=1 Tax=Stylophora pistillata TaxID=50429 RepID=UPI000C0443B5|nr:cytochrome P450 4V2-like [Stylophora pistillata]
MKMIMNKSSDEYLALLTYRDSHYKMATHQPNSAWAESYAQDELLPKTPDYDQVKKKEREYQTKMNSDYDHRHRVVEGEELSPGDRVWIPDMKVEGTVIKPHERPRSVVIQTPNGKVRRNRRMTRRAPKDLVTQTLQWANEYQNGMFCLWLGPTYPFIFLYKPELVEVVLHSSKHISKSADYDFLHPWLGTGLLTSDGLKWKTRRRLITPTFHFSILNTFLQVFEEQSKILVSNLEKKVKTGTFNIMPHITLCALNIMCITSMESSPNAQGDVNSPYVGAVGRITELIQKRQRSPWLWPDIVYFLTPSGREHNHCLQILHGFTNKVIDERIADRATKKNDPQSEECETEQGGEGKFKRKRRLAFLDLLLEAYDRGEISREGIREEVDTFMFEGHDTTAAGITWALYLLARHPHIQQQVHEEVDKFFEQRPETLKVDDLKDLRYLECVVKEAQRMFPSVPFIARRTTEDCHLDGYLAPKGTALGVCTIGLHRNPNVWEAPLEFNPDRFLPESSQGRHPYAFVPFSAGPRNCIGQRFALQEEKLVLAHVMRNFTLDSTQTFDELKACAEIITRPKDGIFVSLARR